MKIKLTVFFLAAVLVFHMTAFKSMAATGVSASFDLLPGASRVAAGDSFTVTVTGKGIRDMYACEVRLTFDNSLLKYAGITSAIQGYKILPGADRVTDKILFAVAKSGSQLPENGDIALCTITFTGIKAGKALITLNTVKLMDEILRSEDYSPGKTIEVSVTGESSPPSPAPEPGTPESVPEPSPASAGGYTAAVRGSDGGLQGNIPIRMDTAAGIAAVGLEALAGRIFSGEGISAVTVPPVSGAKAYTLEIPSGSLSGALGTGLLNFSTEIGGITIPGNMLEGVPEAGGKQIGITIGSGDKSGLSKELKEAIGDKPLVQLTLTLDGVRAGWDNPKAPVKVSVPYTPTVEELADPEHIVVWYIDGEGKAVSVPNGRYSPETGMVTFMTTHFSYYAAAYVHKTFGDLGSVPWAKKAIEVMASKGIIAGTGENTYFPALNITRADYLQLLVNTLGLWAEAGDNFEDVKPDAYYYKAVGIAKELGITRGAGNNRFLPMEPVTRQDMMVLTARALEKSGLKAAGSTSALDRFTDRKDIAGYAAESAATLVSGGLISGSGGRINPRGWTSRAEAAVLLYRIYNQAP